MATVDTTTGTAAEALSRRPGGTYRVEVAGEPPMAAIERQVWIPEVPEPLLMGVRPDYEEVYGVQPGQFAARATTTDVFVSAVASCMLGTFARGLEARGVAITRGQLSAVVESTLAQLGSGARFVERIHLRFTTTLGEEHHDVLRRVFRVFERGCWLSQTLAGSRCTLTSELEIGADGPAE